MRSKLINQNIGPRSTGVSRNYEQIWYCVRLSGCDSFPDGRPVPMQKWKKLKPIWVRLGENKSWAKAISFGPSKTKLEESAENFGAKKIVWITKKNKADFPENSQDLRSREKGVG